MSTAQRVRCAGSGLAQQGDGVGVDGGGHDAGDDGGIAFHEGAGGGEVGGFEDDEAEGFFAGLEGAAGEDDLAGLGGGLQAGEVGADGLFVGVGPRGVGVEARHEFQDVDELRELGRGGSGGGRGRGGFFLVGGPECREDGGCGEGENEDEDEAAEVRAAMHGDGVERWESGKAGKWESGREDLEDG